MPELKPCPFCGSDDIRIGKYGDSEFGYDYGVLCYSCQSHTRYTENKKEAVEAWNRRTNNAAKTD